MDNIWMWVIVAAVAIALVAVLAVSARKKAAVRADERNRHRAGKLREEAELTGVEASQREADAAAARAEAEQARTAADQLARQAKDLEHSAGQARHEADERLVEADHLDPDVDQSARERAEGDEPNDSRALDDARDADPEVTNPRRDTV